MSRNQSLDALRGYAILTMVLSGAIAYGGVLPAWMYHAQVPPPAHQFNPALPGITWVDLVFPFFLFSMGAAIPLSLTKLAAAKAPFYQIVLIAVRRFLLLAFFAFFTEHMRAWLIAEMPGVKEYSLSILAFVLLFFQLYAYGGERHKKLFAVFKIGAYVVAFFLLWLLPLNKGAGFSTAVVDIIILVLANMVLFGTLIWWLTRNRPAIRVGLLAFVMAVFLSSQAQGSWQQWLYNLTPAVWLYKFYFLKYLFIIIPGTFAGEWMLQSAKIKIDEKVESAGKIWLQTLLCFAVVVCNVTLLFNRMLVLNLALTVVAGTVLYFSIKTNQLQNKTLRRFWQAGFYLLLLGLFFEAYEGGIKKDFSTYSYYFVTSGLSYFMLIGFLRLQQMAVAKTVVQYLSLNGRNPMVAYVAGNLLLTPLLHLTGAIQFFDTLNTNAWTGFLRGVLFTAVVSLITVYFSKKGWFWKT